MMTMTISSTALEIFKAPKEHKEQVQLLIDGLKDLPTSAGAFDAIDSVVVTGNMQRTMAGIYLSIGLTAMKDRWDALPLECKGKWNYKFYEYATYRTGFAPSTVDNIINVGRTWLFEPPEGLPEMVQLYDAKGEPTKDFVAADPYSQSVSKLLVSTGALKTGRLGAKALGQLFNPDVSVHVLHDTIRATKPVKSLPAPPVSKGPIRFTLEGPCLVANRNHKSIVIADLDMNAEGDELGKAGIAHILAACQVKVE
jgi:hypothetical protein